MLATPKNLLTSRGPSRITLWRAVLSNITQVGIPRPVVRCPWRVQSVVSSPLLVLSRLLLVVVWWVDSCWEPVVVSRPVVVVCRLILRVPRLVKR